MSPYAALTGTVPQTMPRPMANDWTNYVHLLEPGCPWVPLREWGGLPNVKWCEETLCAVVAEPANTWSNLAYLAVAAVLYFAARKEPSKTLRFWAHAAFWVGTASLAYHATVAFVTQVFDFFGMYFYFLLILGLNLLRLGAVRKERFFRTLWPSIVGFTALTVLVAKVGLPVQGLIGLLIALTLGTEVVASLRATAPIRYGMLVTTLVFISAAAACSAADASRTFCEPSNHLLQGHALWHVLGAVALGASYFYYRQFRPLFT